MMFHLYYVDLYNNMSMDEYHDVLPLLCRSLQQYVNGRVPWCFTFTTLYGGKKSHPIFYTISWSTVNFFFVERVCNDEGYICYFSFNEVIKLYWLILLLYPCELYRLLWASSVSLAKHSFTCGESVSVRCWIIIVLTKIRFELWMHWIEL
jgi:hypothetical protein